MYLLHKKTDLNCRYETHFLKYSGFNEDEDSSNDEEVNDEKYEVNVDASQIVPSVEGGCGLTGNLKIVHSPVWPDLAIFESFGDKLSFKSSPNVWWLLGYLENCHGYIFWQLSEKLGYFFNPPSGHTAILGRPKAHTFEGPFELAVDFALYWSRPLHFHNDWNFLFLQKFKSIALIYS